MKRIYIAFILIIISVLIGVFTRYDINKRSNKYLDYISNIEYYLKKDKYKEAEKECKKAVDDYNYNDSKIMYSYYVHSDLSDIGDNFNSMKNYINSKKKTEYYYISGMLKNRLKRIAEKEPINIQNVL